MSREGSETETDSENVACCILRAGLCSVIASLFAKRVFLTDGHIPSLRLAHRCVLDARLTLRLHAVDIRHYDWQLPTPGVFSGVMCADTDDSAFKWLPCDVAALAETSSELDAMLVLWVLFFSYCHDISTLEKT